MPFKIISVTGAHSQVGKTTLCSILLENLEGFGAIKYTGDSFYTSVIDDTDVILEEDKDTAIMSRSGAKRVVWVKGGGSGLEDALNIAVGKMDGLKGIVVEGNSPARHLKPDLLIFIVGADGQIKASALDLSEKADVIIINSPEKAEPPSFIASLPKQDTTVFRIDLVNQRGDIAGFLSHIKKCL